jgi:hypothetical protein
MSCDVMILSKLAFQTAFSVFLMDGVYIFINLIML